MQPLSHRTENNLWLQVEGNIGVIELLRVLLTGNRLPVIQMFFELYRSIKTNPMEDILRFQVRLLQRPKVESHWLGVSRTGETWYCSCEGPKLSIFFERGKQVSASYCCMFWSSQLKELVLVNVTPVPEWLQPVVLPPWIRRRFPNSCHKLLTPHMLTHTSRFVSFSKVEPQVGFNHSKQFSP